MAWYYQLDGNDSLRRPTPLLSRPGGMALKSPLRNCVVPPGLGSDFPLNPALRLRLRAGLWQFSFSCSRIAAPVSPAEAGSRHSLIARERRAKARLYLMPEQLQ